MNYELTSETKLAPNGETLYRIQAINDIPIQNIKKGDLGGWIGKNAKLLDNAWIIINAQVYGDAQVFGNAWVSGDAQVSGNARVSGNSLVCGNARVSGDAWVYDNAQVYGSARVYGNARVYGDAQVFGDDIIDNVDSIVNIIIPTKYSITITKKYVYIGCKQFTREEMKKSQLKYALENRFTEEEYRMYKKLIRVGMLTVK